MIWTIEIIPVINIIYIATMLMKLFHSNTIFDITYKITYHTELRN